MTADSERKAARSRRRRTPRWPSGSGRELSFTTETQRHRERPLFAFRFSLFAFRFSLFALRFSLFAFRSSLFALRFSLFAFRPELLAFDTGQQVGFGILPNAKR